MLNDNNPASEAQKELSLQRIESAGMTIVPHRVTLRTHLGSARNASASYTASGPSPFSAPEPDVGP